VARILTVDDSSSMRTLVKNTLLAAGHEVQPAGDGEEALGLAQQHTYDLVLTDLHMPRMDGIALVSELRRLPGYDRVPILVLTTEANDRQRRRGRAAGATGWLTKPFNPARLLDTVSRAL
jgi:two-component system chemotaxis response regulator CheY